MNVPKEYLKDWNANLDQGDKKKLEAFCGVTNPVITELFNGRASEDVIIKTNNFFAEKKERVKASFVK